MCRPTYQPTIYTHISLYVYFCFCATRQIKKKPKAKINKIKFLNKKFFITFFTYRMKWIFRYTYVPYNEHIPICVTILYKY